MTSVRDGAVAGATAALTWLLAEPLIRHVTRLSYGDARLLGRLVKPHGSWRAVGVLAHTLNGAAFGATFAAFGRRGVRDGIVAAQIENAALWPMMMVVDPYHPDRASGAWPRLATDRRIILHELVTHTVFGAVLGALTARRS